MYDEKMKELEDKLKEVDASDEKGRVQIEVINSIKLDLILIGRD